MLLDALNDERKIHKRVKGAEKSHGPSTYYPEAMKVSLVVWS